MGADWTGPGLLGYALRWLKARRSLSFLYRRLMPESLRHRLQERRLERARQRHAFVRTPAWTSSLVDSPIPSVESSAGGVGVNVIGYLRAQFGLAESARNYARALLGNGVPVALYDVNLGVPHSRDECILAEQIDTTLPHPISIIFINPDYLDKALAEIGQARLRGGYVIACWFWELEAIPASWLPALQQVDEIMVATEFIEQAVKRVTDKAVLRVPVPLAPIADSGLARSDFGLDSDAFVFLYTFDFSSWVERKNPLAVIAAFRNAFPSSRSDIQLMLKTSNGYRHPYWLNSMLGAAAGDERIMVRDDVIERHHLGALQRCADAYVSLHRAEGFGMGMAECMALGKPVIATAWSGNLEFMDANSAALIDYRLVPVRAKDYREGEGQRWADADVSQAAHWMRRLADDPAFARELGQRGREYVHAVLSPELVARRLAQRLQQIAGLDAADVLDIQVRPALRGLP